jgi:hypothetical protein
MKTKESHNNKERLNEAIEDTPWVKEQKERFRHLKVGFTPAERHAFDNGMTAEELKCRYIPPLFVINDF